MAMPGSGPISLYQANVELSRPGTQAISMADSGLRTLAGVGASGIWSMYSLYGKSSVTAYLSPSTTDVAAGGGRRYTRATITLVVTGGTPTGISWANDGSGGGELFSGQGTTVVQVRGQQYDPFNGNGYYATETIYCNFTVNGVAMSREVSFDLYYPSDPF